MSMFDRLAEVERRYEELERQVADPAVLANLRQYVTIAKERAQLEELVAEQTGRKVELSADVQPDILGGIVLQVGNFVLDASVFGDGLGAVAAGHHGDRTGFFGFFAADPTVSSLR